MEKTKQENPGLLIVEVGELIKKNQQEAIEILSEIFRDKGRLVPANTAGSGHFLLR